MSTLNSPERYRGGFNAPEGYFESLEGHILTKVAVKPPASLSVIRWQRYTWPLAASILLSIATYWLGYERGKSVSHITIELALHDKEALVEYISEHGLLEEYLQQTGYPTNMPAASEWMLQHTTPQELNLYLEEEYDEEFAVL